MQANTKIPIHVSKGSQGFSHTYKLVNQEFDDSREIASGYAVTCQLVDDCPSSSPLFDFLSCCECSSRTCFKAEKGETIALK